MLPTLAYKYASLKCHTDFTGNFELTSTEIIAAELGKTKRGH